VFFRWIVLLLFLLACTDNSEHASLQRARAFGKANDQIRAINTAVEQNKVDAIPEPQILIDQLKNYLQILDDVAEEHDYPMASYFEAIYFAVTNTSRALYLSGERTQAYQLLDQLDPYIRDTHLFGRMKMFEAEMAVREQRLEDAARDFKVAAIFLETLPSYEGASTRLWLCDAWLKSAIQSHRLNRQEEAFKSIQQYADACLTYKINIGGLGHAYGAFIGMLSGDEFRPDDLLVNQTFARIEKAVEQMRIARELQHPDLTEPDTPARHAFEDKMSQRFQANLNQYGDFEIESSSI
jgi:hypothetical protein